RPTRRGKVSAPNVGLASVAETRRSAWPSVSRCRDRRNDVATDARRTQTIGWQKGSGSHFGLFREFCGAGHAGWWMTRLRRSGNPARPYRRRDLGRPPRLTEPRRLMLPRDAPTRPIATNPELPSHLDHSGLLT